MARQGSSIAGSKVKGFQFWDLFQITKSLAKQTMKALRVLFAGVVLCSLLNVVNFTFAQGTAFTYEGRLQNNGSPAGGTYHLTFGLWNASSDGSQLGSTVAANTS